MKVQMVTQMGLTVHPKEILHTFDELTESIFLTQIGLTVLHKVILHVFDELTG